MRILQLAQKPQRRGAEIFARQLGDWLAGEGHAVRHAYLYRYEGDQPLALDPGDVALDHPQGSPLERLPIGNPALVADLRRVIADFQPDVVQANGGRSVKYAALLTRLAPGRSWKLVYRNIDSPVFWVRGAMRTLFMRHWVMPRLDGVVGVSRRTLDEVYDFYRLRVPGAFIPNGIDLAPLADPAPRAEVRRRHDTPEDAVVVLLFGALTAQKRPERFLRLIHRLRADGHGQVVGWLLGDGPDRAALEAQAAELGIADALRFLGYRREVAGPVAASDLYASTSDSEGIPAAVLEAGYLGLPVVAFDVGGMDECVLHGETGRLAPAGDEDALLAEVVDLVTDADERRRLAAAARRFVEAEFSIPSVGRRYLEFYRRVRAGTAPAGRFELPAGESSAGSA